LLFHDHPHCKAICAASAPASWERIASAISNVAAARIRHNQHECVAELRGMGPDWDAGAALVAGLRRIAREFNCAEEFAANHLSCPEVKTGPISGGPMEYSVKNADLREALKRLKSEIETRFQKTLAELYGDQTAYSLDCQIQEAAAFHLWCEEILGRGDPAGELAAETQALAGLGFNPEYLDYYHESFAGQIGRYRFELRPFVFRLGEFMDRILPRKTIPDLATADVKLLTSLSVAVTGDLAGAELACESSLTLHGLDYPRIREVKKLPLAKEITKTDQPSPGLRWEDFLDGVESCGIGLRLDTQVRDDLRRSFATLFDGDDDALLIWCDFTEKLCYTIEARRVMAGGREVERSGALGTVQDPLTAGVGAETRRWVFEEARRRGIRMSDVVEEALQRMQEIQRDRV